MNKDTEQKNKSGEPEQINGVTEAEKIEFKPTLTASQRCKKILYELLDMLKGAAFPFVVMCVFSTTIILFYGFEDAAVQWIAITVGEGLLIAAFVMFGRQNGAAALRRTMLNKAKRKLGKSDDNLLFRTGEYAHYKGFVIGFITTVPFLILQIIECTGDYKFVDFLLQYACGWALAPLDIIGGVSAPYYLFMALFPIAIHGGFYIQGRYAEAKRQAAISRAEDDKRSGKKKHYYEENIFEKDSRYSVDIASIEEGKKGKKRK